MNKRLIVFCSVFAILLLAAIGYVFYRLYDSPSTDKVTINDSRMDALHAIPSDAVAVYDFNSFSEVESVYMNPASHFSWMIDKNSALKKFLEMLPDGAKDWGAVFSLHYSSKNKVSLLFVLSLPKSSDKAEIVSSLDKQCAGVIEKRYGGVIIYKSVVPEISFAVYNNFLIASTSIVIVESSVRHLESNTSIKDNPLFSRMSKSVQGRASIHFNNQNIGKLFSGAVNYDYLGYSDFAANFSSWITADIDASGTYCFGDGKILNTKDEANFSNIFTLQKSMDTEVFRILPYNTNYVVTIPLYSDKEYLSSYKSYLEARKKINDYNYLNAMAKKGSGLDVSPAQWFLSLGVKEMAAASIPGEKSDEKVVLLRVRDISKMRNFSKEVNPFLFKGYISNLLGDLFTPSKDDFYCVISDWVVIGSKKMVEKLGSMNSNELFFSFAHYLDQTPAASSYRGSSSLLAVVNLSKCRDSIASIIKGEYSRPLIAGLDESNFDFLSFKLTNDSGKLNFTFGLYADNLSALPMPPAATSSSASAQAIVDDTPVEIPKGPFSVKNFTNGKTNYIEQFPDGKLRLLDDRKKAVWTAPFTTPICGYVAQVDYFKNNKLQMIFCSGTKLHMLDRLGRWVSPFPVNLKRNVVLGPVVYDFGKNKNYSVMVLHADNKVAFYDLQGKPVKGWNEITAPEKIKSLPVLLSVGENRYWVVRTSFYTLIFDSNGAIVADFSKKKKLRADTKIENKSSKEVIVTTVEDKQMILNLETGAFRKP